MKIICLKSLKEAFQQQFLKKMQVKFYRNDKSQLIGLSISIQYCNSVCLKVGEETRPMLWKVMPSDVWYQLSWNK